MSQPSSPRFILFATAAHRALEGLTRLLSVYLVPAGVALVSVVALLFWNSHYVASGEQQLLLRVVAETGGPLTPQAALRALSPVHPADYYETNLSAAPLWFMVTTRGVPG